MPYYRAVGEYGPCPRCGKTIGKNKLAQWNHSQMHIREDARWMRDFGEVPNYNFRLDLKPDGSKE